MRVSVVAPPPSGAWDEKSLVVRRFANALACFADVELLLPAEEDSVRIEGALTVRRFRSTAPSRDRHALLLELVLGPALTRRSPRCACADDVLAGAATRMPIEVQEELVLSSGSRSPGLLEHLLDGSPGDVVVLCDYAAPVVHDTVRVLPDDRRVVLLPLAAPASFLDLAVHDVVFDRAAVTVVVTEGERVRILGRPTPTASTRLLDLRFVLQVHDLVWKNEPLAFRDTPTVVVPRVWEADDRTDELVTLARDIEATFDGQLLVRLVGPGWKNVPGDLHGPFAESRFDVWRWCCRALAVLDPDPGKLLAREVLEAMMYGTPTVTPFYPGAALEHAQSGSAGLWYRTHSEMEAVLAALLDEQVRVPLGLQARLYADATYRDTDAYIKGVGELLEELLAVP